MFIEKDFFKLSLIFFFLNICLTREKPFECKPEDGIAKINYESTL